MFLLETYYPGSDLFHRTFKEGYLILPLVEHNDKSLILVHSCLGQYFAQHYFANTSLSWLAIFIFFLQLWEF